MKLQLLFLGMCTAKGFGSWVHKTPSHNPTQHEKRLLTAGLVPDSLISLSFPFPWNDLGLLALHLQELTVISLTAYNITLCIIQGVHSTLFSYLKQIKLAQTVNVVESEEIERNDRQEVRSVDSAPNLRFYSWTKVSVFLVCNLVTRRPC